MTWWKKLKAVTRGLKWRNPLRGIPLKIPQELQELHPPVLPGNLTTPRTDGVDLIEKNLRDGTRVPASTFSRNPSIPILHKTPYGGTGAIVDRFLTHSLSVERVQNQSEEELAGSREPTLLSSPFWGEVHEELLRLRDFLDRTKPKRGFPLLDRFLRGVPESWEDLRDLVLSWRQLDRTDTPVPGQTSSFGPDPEPRPGGESQ